MSRLVAFFVCGVMLGAGCERPAAGEAMPSAPPPESPLVLETTYCRVYRNVDRYGVVIYVAEERGDTYKGSANYINGCAGIAILARTEGR